MKLALVLIALTAAAQTKAQTTKVPLSDVRPPGSTTVTLIAYVNDPVSGKASIVPVVVSGSGITITAPTTPGSAYTLQISSTAAQPIWVNDIVTLTAAAPTMQLSTMPSSAFPLQVTRNGLTLTSGADYTLSGSTITFLPDAIPGPGDRMRMLYQR